MPCTSYSPTPTAAPVGQMSPPESCSCHTQCSYIDLSYYSESIVDTRVPLGVVGTVHLDKCMIMCTRHDISHSVSLPEAPPGELRRVGSLEPRPSAKSQTASLQALGATQSRAAHCCCRKKAAPVVRELMSMVCSNKTLLGTLKFEFHVILTCHKILSFF